MKEIILSKPGNPSTYFQQDVEIEGYLSGPFSPEGRFEVILDGKSLPVQNLTTESVEDRLLVRGLCKLSHLIPNNTSDQKNHLFQLCYTKDDSRTLSPPSTISFWPESEWAKPIGGISSPSNQGVYDRDYLVIEGWATKKGQRQIKVEVSLGDNHFNCTKFNTWSPFVGRTLPSLHEAMRAGFSIALSRSQMITKQDSESCLALPLSARVWFEDGTLFEIAHGSFQWAETKGLVSRQRSQRRDKALFIANNLRSTEGAPKVLFEVIKLAREKNYNVEVIAPKGGEFESELDKLGVKIHILPELYLAHYSRLKDFLNQTRRGRELIDEFKPDLIFANTIESFWALDYAKVSEARQLWLIHESIKPEEAFEELEPELRVNFLEALDRADKLIFVAESTAALYQNSVRKTVIIPNGVRPFEIKKGTRNTLRENAQKKLRYFRTAPLLLNVGTICQRKGQDLFLKALKAITHLEWEAVLVGGRPSDYQDRLENQIAEYGFNDRILIVPETREVEDYFLASDILVISSREESAPLVSLEGMNYALPIVSTEAFGLSEQLENSGAALLSPVDNAELLTSHLEKLLKDPPLRTRLGDAGKSWVNKHYNLSNSLRSYSELF